MPHTQEVPKTLVPILGELTILEVILRNLRAVDLSQVSIVVGHRAEAIAAAAPALEARYGLAIDLIMNDQPTWNNAYSLWLAREVLAGGALLVNGDTLHPVAVERALLAQRGPALLLAVDELREVTEESMKVTVDGARRVRKITKQLPLAEAAGEYIGVALVEPAIASDLTAALEATWRRDRQLFYEDAFQLLIDDDREVGAAGLGSVEWIEVDTEADLVLARTMACRC